MAAERYLLAIPAARTLEPVPLRRAVLILAMTLAACGSSSARSTGPSTAGPASGPSRPPCGPVAARTLAASRVARVYVTGGLVYGCSARTPKKFRLGQTKTCLGTPKVTVTAVAGELCAYGLEQCGVDTGTGSLLVRRLSDGRQLRSFAATSPAGPESYRSVASVVLKADGAVAWIGVAHAIISHRSQIEVNAATGASARVLDKGAGIDPRSLRLHRSVLRWSDGGRTRSAVLH